MPTVDDVAAVTQSVGSRHPGRTVGVVGAGAMGAGIAQVAAVAGESVLLYDVEAGRADGAVQDIASILDRLVVKGRLDAAERAAAGRRLRPVAQLADLAAAHFVVEAVVESLPVKRELFAALEAAVGPDAVLATNTSSLSVTEIQDGLAHPGRVVGMHFFNPAPVLPLVEVVSGAATDPAVAAAVFDLAAAWGKTPVHAASTPGFIVNRVARPFYGEAFGAYEQGIADPATIDAVLREGAGFRMGPFELSDLIGHDVNAAVSASVWEQLGEDPRFTPSTAQRELVAAGRLGRKSGQGWYDHRDGTVPPAPATWPNLALVGTHTAAQRSDGDVELSSGGVLARTDGRSAEVVSRESGRPTVVFDLVGDATTAKRVAVAVAAGAPDAVRDQAIALLQAGGLAVSVVADVPGLVVARTLAMLVNIAADAVEADVAEPAAVDLAMVKGVNYPRGPLEWADALGPAYLVNVLDNLAAVDASGRYRVARWLRDRAVAGEPLR